MESVVKTTTGRWPSFVVKISPLGAAVLFLFAPVSTVRGLQQKTAPAAVYVFPNPVPDGQTTVLHISGDLSVKAVRIYDVSGELVEEMTVDQTRPSSTQETRSIEIPLETSRFKPGVYVGVVGPFDPSGYRHMFRFTVVR